MDTQEFQKIVLEELKANKEFQATVLKKFDSIDEKFDSIDKKFDSIDERFDLADKELKAFRSEAAQEFKALNNKIESVMEVVLTIKDDLSAVETITARNYTDIVRLKAIK